jgi:hypothetical protein
MIIEDGPSEAGKRLQEDLEEREKRKDATEKEAVEAAAEVAAKARLSVQHVHYITHTSK